MHIKKSLILFAAATLTASLLPGCLSLTGTETGNGTSGMVMGFMGEPASGVRVALVPTGYNALEPSSGSDPICTTITDAQGRYRFPGLKKGRYNLFCDSGMHAAYADSIKAGGAQGDTISTVFLKKCGSISGTALVSSGKSAPFASVAIIGSRIFTSVNQDDGSFRFPNLAPGVYHAKIITGQMSFFSQDISFHAEEGRSDTLKNPFLLVSTVITALAIDNTGLWIGTVNGLARLSNGTWRVYGLPDGLSSSRINCLNAGIDGTLWAGTTIRLARIRSDSLSENLFPAGLPAITNIASIAEDSFGDLWIGTPQGLFIYSRGGIVKVNWNNDLTGLGSATSQTRLTAVNKIICQGKKTIVGTLHGVYFKDSTAAWQEIPEMANLAVSAMVRSRDGAIWIGTNQGMRKWDPATRMVTAPFEEQSLRDITSLAYGNSDSLYIGSTEGLFLAVDSVIMKKDLGGGSTGVNALALESAGVLWAGTNEGIIRIGPEGIQWLK